LRLGSGVGDPCALPFPTTRQPLMLQTQKSALLDITP
jgi:hypothetical protein